MATTDYTITPSEVVPLSPWERGVAGATITAGQAIVDDPATGRMVLADANHATSTIVGRCKGIAVNNAGAGQHINYVPNGGRVQLDTVQATSSDNYVNLPIYLSDTPGGLCSVDDAKNIGYATRVGFLESNSRNMTVQIAEATGVASD